MATIRQDTFTRADAGSWGTPSDGGTAWTSPHGGDSISSNVGLLTGNAAQVRQCYTTLSQDNGIIITFTMKSWASTSDCYSIMIKANGGNRDGFGLEIGPGSSSNLVIRDSTTYPLGTGSFTFSNGTDYLFEIDISATYAMDVYIWASGGSKPGSPNVSSSAGTRTGAGTKFQFCNGGGGGSGEVMKIVNWLVKTPSTDYSMAAALGTYTYTGINAVLTSARSIAMAVGAFTLTGIDAALKIGKGITAAVGSFVLTGQDAVLTSARNMTAAVGTFILTGIDASFAIVKNYTITAAVGAFNLTGYAVRLLLNGLSAVWTNPTKNNSTFTNQGRNTSNWDNQNKS